MPLSFFFPDKKTKGYRVEPPVLLLQANNIKDYNMQNKPKKNTYTQQKKVTKGSKNHTHKSEKSGKGWQRRKEGVDKKIKNFFFIVHGPGIHSANYN